MPKKTPIELEQALDRLLDALKPRLERAATRAPEESREAYLRAIAELAIDSFIRGQ